MPFSARSNRLVEALQRLPLDLQMAIELYYWEELSVAELAEALEIPAGTVKSRLHRA
ncbi:MAG: sigma-70 family RNA polymerase sigma factor [Polyangiaceae bacterium]